MRGDGDGDGLVVCDIIEYDNVPPEERANENFEISQLFIILSKFSLTVVVVSL